MHGPTERKEWLVLEGTVGTNGKPISAVGEVQLKILRAAREEVRVPKPKYALLSFPSYALHQSHSVKVLRIVCMLSQEHCR